MRKRHSEINKGRTLSEEAKAKISAANKGNFTSEQREALKPVWQKLGTEQAEKMGVDVDAYLSLPQPKKKVVIDRFKYGGFKPEDLMKDLMARTDTSGLACDRSSVPPRNTESILTST